MIQVWFLYALTSVIFFGFTTIVDKLMLEKRLSSFSYFISFLHILTEPAENKIGMLPRLPPKSALVLVGVSFLGIAYYLYTTQPQNAVLAALVGSLLVLIPIIPVIRGPTEEKKWREEE